MCIKKLNSSLISSKSTISVVTIPCAIKEGLNYTTQIEICSDIVEQFFFFFVLFDLSKACE